MLTTKQKDYRTILKPFNLKTLRLKFKELDLKRKG